MVNKVILLGYLSKDPVLCHTSNGVSYTRLTVITKRTWRDTDGLQHTETDWHTVHVWRKHAEACTKYLRRNQLVYIEGRLHLNEWKDEQNKNHRRTEIVAEMIRFLSSGHTPVHQTTMLNE